MRTASAGPVAMVAAATLLVLHGSYITRLQGAACIDDAYISFRYARNLVAGHGLTFNPGERVEGYTNFAWTMAMAGVQAAGLDVPAAARTLNGGLGFLLVLAALLFLARRGARPGWAVPLAGLLLVCDASLARWSQDGLEVVLFSGLVFLAAWRDLREREDGARGVPSGLLFGLAALVRPEGALFFAVAMAHRGLTGGRSARNVLRPAAWFAALVVPHLAWRLWYYGALLPNTFHAKVGATGAQVERGSAYVAVFLLQRWPLALLAALALFLMGIRSGRERAWHGQFAALAAAHLAYVALIGGDWMGPGRFLVPVLPFLYLPAADLASRLLGSRPVRDAALLLTLAAWHLYATGPRSEWRSVRDERPFSESRIAVALWLRDAADPGDTVLTNEIGQIGWFSRLVTHDLHGLTDSRIARRPAAAMGEGKPGHEKADADYSFSRKPTWVVVPDVAVDYAKNRDSFPPFADYEMFLVPPSPPRPEYQVILRRRPPAADPS